jgi:hypothetical protein
MAENVVLIVKCQRAHHEVLKVTGADAALYAETRRLAVGRKRSQWTPASWQVADGNHARRCGCACGQSWLIADGDIRRWLDAGYAEIILPAARIGRIGPVRLGANKHSPMGPRTMTPMEHRHAPESKLPAQRLIRRP